MKKLLRAIIIFLALSLLPSCHSHKEVSREWIDTRYTAAHDEIQIGYMTVLDGDGNVSMIPYFYSEHYPEKYETLYRITYDDGCMTKRWEVTR